MEKKGLRKKDILRMDGLLPPTRRLPVCNAVSGGSDKKKDKKWSLGGILRRISSIKDYDSSSNDEEIVYCKKTPRKPAKLNKSSNGVVLRSIDHNLEQEKRGRVESNSRHSPLHLRRDSLHSRSSEGSLDGLGKKSRKYKLKARAEAKRDHLCGDSSSEEDCGKSSGSLNKFHGVDGSLNGQKGHMCNRKTRAARTERYIKRLSKDDGSSDTLNDAHRKRLPAEHIEDEQQQQQQRAIYAEANRWCRPPVHPRRELGAQSSSCLFPVYRSSAENLGDANCTRLPDSEVGSLDDFRRHSVGQYATDLNQNNTYGKIARNVGRDAYTDGRPAGNFFTYPTKNACYYPGPFDYAVDCRLINADNRPPEPPPRWYRPPGYGYSSYSASRRHIVPNFYEQESDKANVTNGVSRPDWGKFRSYGSSNEIAWCSKSEPRDSVKLIPRADFRNSLESINNKYNSSYRRESANESAYKETEAMKCRRRNTRNDELNCSDMNYSGYKVREKSANICDSGDKHETALSSDWPFPRSCEPVISHTIAPTNGADKRAAKSQTRDNGRTTPTEEEVAGVLERRRSSRNLEEALSELEAIYKSLRLGDEELLGRAERRSMEEFSLKQGMSELDASTAASITPDSPDRTKDDMAYRRMHPKEWPTALSDVAGRSTLSNISYLIASPVLSRRDSTDDLALASPVYCHPPSRRDEPDITRDDVVFRSMSRANNTLRVIDPQPPFGIPLGPVSGATESDYLHTTPSKPEQPRSSYIPQCEPDVVTDDLAYRALRKDVGAARGTAESRIDVSREPTGPVGTPKKRAVRSMSANLYGLINRDRIHLRREPPIGSEVRDAARSFAATAESPEYPWRVASDGELSDSDARRRKEPARHGDTDINGNHPPAAGAYRTKLFHYRAERATRESPEKKKGSIIAEPSEDNALSSRNALQDEFWYDDYLRPDSDASNVNSVRSTEADFTEYSRLCQDLVNMIESADDASPTKSPSANDYAVPFDESNDSVVRRKIDEPPASARSSSDRSGSRIAARVNDKPSETESEGTESSVTFSTDSTKPGSSESTPVNNYDFYLRVADENVKLIAEAFSSVADDMRDASRLSALRKNSPTSRDLSEIEDRSGSARSSALYSQDDAGNDRPRSAVASPTREEARAVPKRHSPTNNERDQSESRSERNALTADVDLDLSKAVGDLLLAAASLCEHGREIENLGLERGRKIETTPIAAVDTANASDDVDDPIRKINFIAVTLKEQQRKQEEEEEEDEAEREKEKKDALGAGESEDGPIRRLSLVADTTWQERERDQEETVVLPNELAETRSDAREENGEGERTVCCELDRKLRRYAADARPHGEIFCVTNNLITRATVTTYSVILLACLLALLLAIVAAS